MPGPQSLLLVETGTSITRLWFAPHPRLYLP
jgi:hypothetical protein